MFAGRRLLRKRLYLCANRMSRHGRYVRRQRRYASCCVLRTDIGLAEYNYGVSY